MKITLAIISQKSVHRIGFKDFFLNVRISVSTSGSQSFIRTKQGKKPKHNYRVLSKFTVKDLLPFIRVDSGFRYHILTSNHEIGICQNRSHYLTRLVFVIAQPPTPEAHCKTPSCHGNVLKVAMAAIVSFSFHTQIRKGVHSLKPNLTLVIGCFYIHTYLRSIAHSAHVFGALEMSAQSK